jgi:hypothetical protein
MIPGGNEVRMRGNVTTFNSEWVKWGSSQDVMHIRVSYGHGQVTAKVTALISSRPSKTTPKPEEGEMHPRLQSLLQSYT